ncbi:hypothetical protein EYF80_024038 [Liparis tanakae]|uniref:Uncharacterized protein n=1 Tax=Liparis tanakae TaxID=230148 RepID=A0A4Z2HKD0_9TELE|nr:hypothetical protein EYF80_024038 [Liparis tanakae]
MREPGLLGNHWPQVRTRLTDTWLQAVLCAVEMMEEGGFGGPTHTDGQEHTSRTLRAQPMGEGFQQFETRSYLELGSI